MEMIRGFQPACVVIAGAELDLFTLLRARPRTAAQVARKIGGNPRATVILLDALAALKMLTKTGGARPVYGVPDSVAAFLAEGGPASMVGMVRHLGNCLRNWGQLAHVVLRGKPVNRQPSVRGAEGDLTSFIQAMHEVSTPMAAPLIGSLGRLEFKHLLDVAGASGTWTIPFLRMNPAARATVFDLPEVVPMAKRLVKKVGLASRVQIVGGDYHTDTLPAGADLAWVSAIVHQNSDEENRALYRRIFAALQPGGRILIRDIVMDDSRTRPAGGALFAVNMLVGTRGGSTYTFAELRDALTEAGFKKVRYLRRGEAMDSVVCATKP